MTKPTDTRDQNPFTRVLSDEERAIVDPNPNRHRQVLLKKPPTQEEREALAKKIDADIREKAQKIVRAQLDYAAVKFEDGAVVGPEWMDDEAKRLAVDAQSPDKEVPFAQKVAVRIFESYQKQETEERKSLSVTINMFGDTNVQNVYERQRVDK